MIRDLYTRNPEDPNFRYGILEHHDAIESIVTKIKMILGTRPGEVFGDTGFGIGIEDYVFETRINKRELEEKIKMQIDRYISEAVDYNIQPIVSFGKGDGYDYAVIDFYIDNTKAIGILIK